MFKNTYDMPRSEEPNEEMNDRLKESNVIRVNPLDFIVYIVGEITLQTAVQVTQQMVGLDKLNSMSNLNYPITMIVNSGGGSVNAAWQICDVMDYIRTPVHTTGLGEICSASLMIFMNGQQGHRVITDKTSIMSHLYSWGTAGTHNNLISANKEFQSLYGRMLNHYLNCTGLPKEKIEKELLCEHDVWLTAKEALKYNLADEIVKSKDRKFKDVKKKRGRK